MNTTVALIPVLPPSFYLRDNASVKVFKGDAKSSVASNSFAVHYVVRWNIGGYHESGGLGFG